MKTQVPTGIQDQCSVYLTVNTPGQPNLGTDIVYLLNEVIYNVNLLFRYGNRGIV